MVTRTLRRAFLAHSCYLPFNIRLASRHRCGFNFFHRVFIYFRIGMSSLRVLPEGFIALVTHNRCHHKNIFLDRDTDIY